MKKSDIAMIILIASVSAMIAFAVANAIPVLKPQQGEEKVKTITEYDDEVATPDPKTFNSEAINPTVKTVIGSDAAQN